MFKKVSGILLLVVSTLVTIFLGTNIGKTPSIGQLLSPSHGFWSNIETQPLANKEVVINAIHGKARVIYDENHIPHIFADNEEDLFYAQGYVMAKDRLWQMEFISLVASGRLSEVVGEQALPLDRFHRRIGLKKSAEEALPFMLEDPVIEKTIHAFSKGVNKFISEAKRDQLPIEYKLLGYRPEKWVPFNSALLLKYMAQDLTGRDYDIEYTNAINQLGREIFNIIYPDFPSKLDPIIPLETEFKFEALPPPSTLEKAASIDSKTALYKNPITSFLPYKGLGSNNWVVSGSKTESGMPILCNDPHLSLSFPSIWYEMQLQAPGLNVYGVSLPGSPGIIIGYNEKIAWGVTNAGMDVRDWYTVERNPKNNNQYRIGNNWAEFEIIEEKYKVKGGKNLSEEIKWTKVGPVVYDQDFDSRKDKKDLAMSWTALHKSNDLKAFYLLNHAQSHDDYLEALSHYWCPAQNFVYADVENNIAIKEQGKLWIRNPEQGKFLQNLSQADTQQIFNYFIPNEHLPHSFNPTRGFLSSANQIPTGKEYPYYVLGPYYENFRNRRINEVLAANNKIDVEDMKALQYDNVSVHARDALPIMLPYVEKQFGSTEVFKRLSNWNYVTNYESRSASYFYKWWEILEKTIWDELKDTEEASFIYPTEYTTIDIMRDRPNFALFDIKGTPQIETLQDVLSISLDSTIAWFDRHPDQVEFKDFKNTSITHLSLLKEFSEDYIKIGGYSGIVNATSSRWGASVRLIIDFKDGEVQGYGMYPGGQSGNPGSAAYNTFVDAWTEGKYYKHKFFKSLTEAQKTVN